MAVNELWQGFLEQNPDIYYQGMIPKGTPGFADYWRRQSGNVWNQYQGALGQQVLGGGVPNMMFGDFLNQYPFAKYWSELSPASRGINMGALSPGLLWRM
uniref:Uncharacterized protein n=1 Tax=viral metagenome TaxID=1070528 RepID=A0A6M3IZL7_9ZZZZ